MNPKPPCFTPPRGGALALLSLAACRATAATPAPVTAPPIAAPEAPAPGLGDVLVRAREAPAMPTCEATDAITAAALSPGVAGRPSLARRADGGLVAFVTDPHGDGATKLDLLALDAQGSPTDESGRTRAIVELADVGAAPAYPALAAWRDGYPLAGGAVPAAQQRVTLRAHDARGIPTGDARAPGTAGWLGPAALDSAGARWPDPEASSAARSANAGSDAGAAWASHLDVIDDANTVRSTEAPDGAAFDGRAPVLVSSPRAVRAYVTAMRSGAGVGDERALLMVEEGRASMVARDLDQPAALALADGVLVAWRARMTRHDAAVRAAVLPFEGDAPMPPVTLATYRGAYDAQVALAPVGQGMVGAFTVSTLADDGAGTLNVSLLDARGGYVGRAPVLTSFPSRSARVVAAAPPPGASDDSVWFAIDGRDADGSGPELLLTRARCDAARPRDRLDVPPGTFEQDLSAPDAAPVSLARDAAEMRCAVRATGTFTPHVSASDDGTAGTAGAVAVTASGAVLMAVTKQSATARPRLMVSTLDAQGRLSPARAVMDNPARLLALEPVAGGALAVVTYTFQSAERADLVFVRGAAVSHSLMPAGLRDPSSAVIAPDGTTFAVGETDAGDTVLAQIPWSAGRAGAPVLLARLRAGDAVLDVMRQGSEWHALLGRPDAMGAELGQAVARVIVPDGAHPTEAARNARDPFIDALGHPRGAALWARVANAPALVYDERNVLRVAAVVDGQPHAARSALELMPGGGAVLASTWGGAARWLALATGDADAQHATLRAVTLAALDDRGEVSVSTRLPEDANAIARGTAIGASGDHVVILHPRTEARGGITWAWVDATCPRTGGAR